MTERIFIVPPIVVEGMQEDRRPPITRFWQWLGFGAKHNPGFDDVGNHGNPDWAPGEMSAYVDIHFDLWDRLRVLIGGPVVVSLRTRTDVLVSRAETMSVVGVMWPGYPKPKRRA